MAHHIVWLITSYSQPQQHVADNMVLPIASRRPAKRITLPPRHVASHFALSIILAPGKSWRGADHIAFPNMKRKA